MSYLVDSLHDELEEALGGGEDDAVFQGRLPTEEYFRMDVKVSLTCDSCSYSR